MEEMMSDDRNSSDKNKVLIVDDEEDIHDVTTLSLKRLKYKGKRTDFLAAHTGEEAVQMVREQPDIAVILLDVVMETNTAGLDACRTIRETNPLVRILLRTGQPGSVPEKETIDAYDIDGYISKADLTSTKLYSYVRTALKAFGELQELDRHRTGLSTVNECALAVHSFEPLQNALERILAAAMSICPATMAVLYLETFESNENPTQYLMNMSVSGDSLKNEAWAGEIKTAIQRMSADERGKRPHELKDGILAPFILHRELGSGWIFFDDVGLDPLTEQLLTLLSGHAANALYSTVAQSILVSQEDEQSDAMSV
jgi:CheY-like chemotaxis protein